MDENDHEIADLSQNASVLVQGFTSLKVNNNVDISNRKSNFQNNSTINNKIREQQRTVNVKGSQSSTDDCTITPDSIGCRIDEMSTINPDGAINLSENGNRSSKCNSDNNNNNLTHQRQQYQQQDFYQNDPKHFSAFKLRKAAPREMYIDTPLKDLDKNNENLNMNIHNLNTPQTNANNNNNNNLNPNI